jgi:hypothetical protein
MTSLVPFLARYVILVWNPILRGWHATSRVQCICERVRYPGQHPPLIDRATWDAVQAQLAANHHENRTRTNVNSKSLLAGLVYDDAGNRLVSSHATKTGRRYRRRKGLSARRQHQARRGCGFPPP